MYLLIITSHHHVGRCALPSVAELVHMTISVRYRTRSAIFHNIKQSVTSKCSPNGRCDMRPLTYLAGWEMGDGTTA